MRNQFDFIDKAILAARAFADLPHYSSIILSKANHRSEQDDTPWFDQRYDEKIYHFVESGKTLIVLHSGLVGYEQSIGLRKLSGGVFLHHPPMCRVTIKPHPSHQLANGVAEYTEYDEHYFVQLDDQDSEVFLMSESVHGAQPAGWIRKFGLGRVIVLTPSHTDSGWQESILPTFIKKCI